MADVAAGWEVIRAELGGVAEPGLAAVVPNAATPGLTAALWPANRGQRRASLEIGWALREVTA